MAYCVLAFFFCREQIDPMQMEIFGSIVQNSGEYQIRHDLPLPPKNQGLEDKSFTVRGKVVLYITLSSPSVKFRVKQYACIFLTNGSSGRYDLHSSEANLAIAMKKNQVSTGIEPMTLTLPVRCSTN